MFILFRFNGIETTCNHGECVEGNNTANIHTENFCICEIGWSGPNCDQPICYWQCDDFGGTCENPNQCNCVVDHPICKNPPTTPPTTPCDPLCNCDAENSAIELIISSHQEPHGVGHDGDLAQIPIPIYFRCRGMTLG